MGNGRCRVHGGLSTGPRTPEGLERSRRANWKHGYYSAEAKAARREARKSVRLFRRLAEAERSKKPVSGLTPSPLSGPVGRTDMDTHWLT
jgi:hypothetical protein